MSIDTIFTRNMFSRTLRTGLSAAVLCFLALSCEKSDPAGESGIYTLTVIARNGNVAKMPDKQTYNSGEIVTLAVVPNAGYTFLNWSGDASGTNTTAAVFMDANKSVTAVIVADSTSPVTDADGTVYQTIRIGSQVWTVENLRTTKYNDSSAIPLVTDSAAWAVLTSPGFCYYNNTSDADSIEKFGALYNWYAVNTKKLAPTGWRVPDTADWKTLQRYLIANAFNWDETKTGNKIAKSLAATMDWKISTNSGAVGKDLNKNNGSGFSMLPGGYRFFSGNFYYIGLYGYCWSATGYLSSSAYYYYLWCDNDCLMESSSNKGSGCPVRLVRDAD